MESKSLIPIEGFPRGSAGPDDVERIEAFVGQRLADDFLQLLDVHDGAEGWVGDSYVSLWPADEIVAHNKTLETHDYAPGLLLFGTDGGGEAYAIDFASDGHVVSVPMVGLCRDLVIEVGANVLEWLADLQGTSRSPPESPQAPRMNLMEIHPVILGGDPTDSANKALVPLSDLLVAAAWWNARIKSLRDGLPNRT